MSTKQSTKHPKLTESEKRTLRTSADLRITSLCCYAALIIILIDLAAFIVGDQNSFFMVVGIMVAIALLASAGIQFCAIQKTLYSELEEAKHAADTKRTAEVSRSMGASHTADEKHSAVESRAAAVTGTDTQHSTKI